MPLPLRACLWLRFGPPCRLPRAAALFRVPSAARSSGTCSRGRGSPAPLSSLPPLELPWLPLSLPLPLTLSLSLLLGPGGRGTGCSPALAPLTSLAAAATAASSCGTRGAPYPLQHTTELFDARIAAYFSGGLQVAQADTFCSISCKVRPIIITAAHFRHCRSSACLHVNPLNAAISL